MFVLSTVHYIQAHRPWHCQGYFPVSVTFKRHWYLQEMTKSWMVYLEKDLMYKLITELHSVTFLLIQLVDLKNKHNDHVKT